MCDEIARFLPAVMNHNYGINETAEHIFDAAVAPLLTEVVELRYQIKHLAQGGRKDNRELGRNDATLAQLRERLMQLVEMHRPVTDHTGAVNCLHCDTLEMPCDTYGVASMAFAVFNEGL